MTRNIPLDVILSWPKPNLVDPERRGWGVLIATVILLTLNIPVVSIRIYTRHFMRHWLGWDDFFCVIGLVLAIGFGVGACISCYVYDADRHIWDLPLNVFSHGLRLAMALKVLFTLAGTVIRQSLLCFYLRLLGDAGIRWFAWVIWAATALNVAMGLCFSLLAIIECIPISAYWHFPSNAYGHCIHEGAKTFASGIIIAALDLMVVLLPIPIVGRLQMSKRAKLGVIILLSLGLVATASAIVRTYYIYKALIGSYDLTWWTYLLWLWCLIEINLALLCSCAPAIRPFVATYAPWFAQMLSRVGSRMGRWTYRPARNGKYSTGETDGTGMTQTTDAPSGEVGSSKTTVVNVSDKQSSADSRYKDRDVEKGNNFLLSATRAGSDDGMVDVMSTTYSNPKSVEAYPMETYHRENDNESLNKAEVLAAISNAIRGVGFLHDPVPDSFNISRGNSRANSRVQSRANSRPGTKDHDRKTWAHAQGDSARGPSGDYVRAPSLDAMLYEKLAKQPDRVPAGEPTTIVPGQARPHTASEHQKKGSWDAHRLPQRTSDTSDSDVSAPHPASLDRGNRPSAQFAYGYGPRQTHAGIGSIANMRQESAASDGATQVRQWELKPRAAGASNLPTTWQQARKAERSRSTSREPARSRERPHHQTSFTGSQPLDSTASTLEEEPDQQSPWPFHRTREGRPKGRASPQPEVLLQSTRFQPTGAASVHSQTDGVNFSQPRRQATLSEHTPLGMNPPSLSGGEGRPAVKKGKKKVQPRMDGVLARGESSATPGRGFDLATADHTFLFEDGEGSSEDL